ncbi:hypothetical protein B9Z19DRAFT_1155919 [Tuber borchii]|uniref:Uncharacterized protein n=1 Tax=Tuber borchii TaxID=42251 RepID=A0A2T7A462_TUBBO|nr:hypothetical protein B9Z19DRAFT_1155919 [Tuber borchii]
MEIRLLDICTDADTQDRCNVDHWALEGASMTRITEKHLGVLLTQAPQIEAVIIRLLPPTLSPSVSPTEKINRGEVTARLVTTHENRVATPEHRQYCYDELINPGSSGYALNPIDLDDGREVKDKEPRVRYASPGAALPVFKMGTRNPQHRLGIVQPIPSIFQLRDANTAVKVRGAGWLFVLGRKTPEHGCYLTLISQQLPAHVDTKIAQAAVGLSPETSAWPRSSNLLSSNCFLGK